MTDLPAPPLNLSQAAELLNVHPGTLRSWRAMGRGPASFKIGSRVMYDRDALVAWIDQQRATTTNPGDTAA
ncbi:helix-turn-helix domain-containing protein [Corynebacterium variabile]|uniref:Helix-turn-helix domain-containing protein n=1 Tax=Corynebacterium variabile TaxID=1727 RepID=A0A4Y4C815_9CORY|nr:helix-turn-helix domain-containing protein [Corynebacterium variabile]GEC87574.1 hypothetical protein CVA01_28880 [Corynebacterium variabile]